MANRVILLDTSILIDYFRKTNKANSTLITLFDLGFEFCISAITHYEIYTGATTDQIPFWTNVLNNINVIAFDKNAAQTAVDTNKLLKNKRMQIAMADLFIAATAISNQLPLATLNRKHFDRVEGLSIV
jgi:tRNA(fMet)-specific endonuclease VapC